MNLNQLGSMALVLVLAGIVITVGAAILDELAEDRCEDSGGTYHSWIDNGTNGVSSNTCCTSARNSTYCYDYLESGVAYNTTLSGLEGLATFGDWLPLISLVVVASIVIGIIITYMGQR